MALLLLCEHAIFLSATPSAQAQAQIIRERRIVKTQLNVTQLKATKSNFVEVRHSSHLEPTPPTHPPQSFQPLLDQIEIKINQAGAELCQAQQSLG